MPMMHYTSEDLNPSEMTLLIIRQIARAYNQKSMASRYGAVYAN